MNLRNSISGWYFTDQQIREALGAGRMLNASLDLSNACNLNCPYCFVEDKASARKVRRVNELTLAETLAVIDDFGAAGATTVNLVGAGEPTIDPHFREVIRHIAAKDMTAVVFTNGIRCAHDPVLVDEMYECGASVVLKYNSRSAVVQDIVAGREGYSAKRDRALELLLDAGFAAHEPTRLGVDIIVFRGNLHEVPEIHSWARANNIFPIAGEYIPTGRTADGAFLGDAAVSTLAPNEQQRVIRLLQPINADERRRLNSEIADIDRRLGLEHPVCPAYFGGGQCTQTLGVYVDLSGHIWPCVARTQLTANGHLLEPLGNVRAGQSVMSIWSGHPYMEYIRDTFDGGCPYKAKLA